MKLSVTHPEDETLTATVGLDHAVGWFATVQRRASRASQGGRVVAKVDALETGSETSLGQVLEVLSTWGFWTADDFSEALALSPQFFPCEMAAGPRRVAEILETLRAAAGGR